MKKEVQVFINNLLFPKTLDELLNYASCGETSNVETIINHSTIDCAVARWAQINDIVFFSQAKTSNTTISKLKSDLNSNLYQYNQVTINKIDSLLKQASTIYKHYGGKIFAIGIITSKSKVDPQPNRCLSHFSMGIYAQIKIIKVLEEPLNLNLIKDKIRVVRNSQYTYLNHEDYHYLLNALAKNNKLPAAIKNIDVGISDLLTLNRDNWFEIGLKNNQHYFHKAAFKNYFSDYLLSYLGDRNRIYRECICIKSTVEEIENECDNVIYINHKYLTVAIRLDIRREENLREQLKLYCHTNRLLIDQRERRLILSEQIYQNYVLVIDTNGIYFYDDIKQSYEVLEHYSNLNKIEDLAKVRQQLHLLTNKSC